MERYSFFNSVNKDRLYDAQDFTRYFSQFITNGIFPNPANALFVKSNGDNTLTLCNGQAWINGYMYELTEDGKVFTIDTDTRRTIQIVLRLDLINRNMKTYIKDGTDLERNDNIYELQLATIKIHNSIIEQSDITDTRLNSKVCGIVSLGLDHIDTSLIFEQFQSWFNQEKDRYNNSIDEWVDEKKKAFDLWFDGIQDILKNNPVADLVGKFEKLRYDIFQLVEIYKHEIYESMAILEKRNRSNIKNEVARLEFKLKASLIKIDNALKSLDETKDNAVKDINTAKDDFKKDMDKMKTQIKQDVDNTLSRVDGRINNIDNRVTNIEQKINSSLEVDISANKVKLNNSKFSSNNVDGALTELFTYADNGKKNWVDVIGSPLSNSDNFSTLKNKTQGLKTNFANKLNSQGKSVSQYDSLDTLINNIGDSEEIDYWLPYKKVKNFTIPAKEKVTHSCSISPYFICFYSAYQRPEKTYYKYDDNLNFEQVDTIPECVPIFQIGDNYFGITYDKMNSNIAKLTKMDNKFNISSQIDFPKNQSSNGRFCPNFLYTDGESIFCYGNDNREFKDKPSIFKYSTNLILLEENEIKNSDEDFQKTINLDTGYSMDYFIIKNKMYKKTSSNSQYGVQNQYKIFNFNYDCGVILEGTTIIDNDLPIINYYPSQEDKFRFASIYKLRKNSILTYYETSENTTPYTIRFYLTKPKF